MKNDLSITFSGDIIFIVFYAICVPLQMAIIFLFKEKVMKFAKRSLSMLLIFCMIFGMIPFVASAAEGGEQGNVHNGSIFKDVKETSWYYDAVNYVYTNGIMVGTSDDLFSPGEVTSRSMLVTILYGMEGKPAVQSESPFTDVANGRWYTDAIVWASENGIVSGYGNGIFGYKDAVNRQQTAMILYRYAEYKGYNTEITGDVSSFVDKDDISSYAVDALSWAVGKGLISGTGSNMISPKGSATRSQIAVIVMQFDREIAEKSTSGEGTVEYAEGVEEVKSEFTVDDTKNAVYLDSSADTSDWKAGDVKILKSRSGNENDIAVKVVGIRQTNGMTVVEYEEPELGEVVESFDVSGTVAGGNGTITPAEGVVFHNAPASRSTVETLPLFGKVDFTVTIDDIEIPGYIDVQNIEYRFIANPSLNPPFVNIDEVYFVLNSEASFDIHATIESDIPRKKLCDINVPLQYGFNVSGEVFFIIDASGSLKLSVELDNKVGVHYTKDGGVNPICDVDPDYTPVTVEGEFEAGLAFEPGAEFLGIDLVAIGAKVGVGLAGELSNVRVSPFEFCLDGTIYVFVSIYARIGPEDLRLEIEKDLFGSDGPFAAHVHFEETGKVEECTRPGCIYYVLGARRCCCYNDHDFILNHFGDWYPRNIKVELYCGDILVDTQYTHGMDDYGNNPRLRFILQEGKTYTFRATYDKPDEGCYPYEETFIAERNYNGNYIDLLLVPRPGEGHPWCESQHKSESE